MQLYNDICANTETQGICVKTYPTGPRGRGIKEISQTQNRLIVTYDDDKTQEFMLPDWWFGTREEYNSLPEAEKTEKSLYFIEEGT